MLFLRSNSVVVLRKAELDSAPTLVQADAFGMGPTVQLFHVFTRFHRFTFRRDSIILRLVDNLHGVQQRHNRTCPPTLLSCMWENMTWGLISCDQVGNLTETWHHKSQKLRFLSGVS